MACKCSIQLFLPSWAFIVPGRHLSCFASGPNADSI
jgi:hypothetical protein